MASNTGAKYQQRLGARWVGQVVVNQTENQTSKDGVGIRVRTRILFCSLPNGEGTHSPDLPKDSDLPLVTVQMPPTAGYGNRLDTGLVGGETVTGYFMNGDLQVPVIDGVLVRTDSSNQITAQEAEAAGTSRGLRVNPFSQNKELTSPTNRTGGVPPSTPAKPSSADTGLKSLSSYLT